jgi:polar amino acid transport system ATP-binding protein
MATLLTSAAAVAARAAGTAAPITPAAVQHSAQHSSTAAPPLLKVDDLRKRYGSTEVLRGLSFQLQPRETLALIGPSGSGKSTCLRCINLLEKPDEGRVILDGQAIGEVSGHGGRGMPGRPKRWMSDRQLAPQRRHMGMVFQHFHLWPHLTVRENVALAPIQGQGLDRRAAEALADAMLDKVQMAHKAREYPERLSGGQQQRVAIARALAQRPKLMLFDEPTSALDPELVGEVLGVIRALAREGTAMLLVTHEIRFAREVADRVVFMDGGVIVEQGQARDLIDRPQTPRLAQFLGQLPDSGAPVAACAQEPC